MADRDPHAVHLALGAGAVLDRPRRAARCARLRWIALGLRRRGARCLSPVRATSSPRRMVLHAVSASRDPADAAACGVLVAARAHTAPAARRVAAGAIAARLPAARRRLLTCDARSVRRVRHAATAKQKYPRRRRFVRERRLPSSAFVLAMQHSGSIRYYARPARSSAGTCSIAPSLDRALDDLARQRHDTVRRRRRRRGRRRSASDSAPHRRRRSIASCRRDDRPDEIYASGHLLRRD